MVCFACNILQSQTAGEHLFMEHSLGVLNGGRYLKQPRELFPRGGSAAMIHKEGNKQFSFFLYKSQWFKWSDLQRVTITDYPINSAFNGIFENYCGPPVISQPGISFCCLATAQKSSFNAIGKKKKR